MTRISPRISRQEVLNIAHLARLTLADDEADAMTDQLDQILDYVATLDELDTDGIEPTSHVLSLTMPVREDRADPAIDPELALSNAPEREGTAFVVPKVISSDEEG